jgi:hypothetical protein
MEEPATLGSQFAQALASKDYGRLSELLHPEVDFRGITPNRVWEAHDPAEVISGVLQHWFEDHDEIQELVQVDHDGFVDRERIGYRFRVRNPDGEFLVEQQAYVSSRDGRIGWMRVVCSGFRAIP